MGVVEPLLTVCLFVHAVIGMTGPPAARPPDVESLQRSLNDSITMKRVIITKSAKVTTAVEGATTTEGSEFADRNFSTEMKEEETVKEKTEVTEQPPSTEVTTVKTETTTETVIEEKTEAPTTKFISTESLTTTTVIPLSKRIEIKKIVRTTTPPPPPEDQLSPLDELRLLKKLAKQGIAFGVKNKELELIHTPGDELELPPFAFNEDENEVTDEPAEIVQPTITEKTTTAKTTTETTTTPTTPKPVTATTTKLTTTIPSSADIEVLEKELVKYKEEPFKVGTNIVPLHLFFDQNMRIHKRRKIPKQKALVTLKTEKPIRPSSITMVSTSSSPPRTDDFLVPKDEEATKAEDEKKIDAFRFPVMPVIKETNVTKPIKVKNPKKMILPTLLEMPKLASLSSFGSLAAPIYPYGLSQRIKNLRLDSEAQINATSKSRTSGKMFPKGRRRLMRKKIIRGAPTMSVDGIALPQEPLTEVPKPRKQTAQLKQKSTEDLPFEKTTIKKENIKIITKPVERIWGRQPPPEIQTKLLPVKEVQPRSQLQTLPQIASNAKIFRTNDVAKQEKEFAESLTKKQSAVDLVVDSLRKMKKILKRHKPNKARANAAPIVQIASHIHSHDGETKSMKIDGNTEESKAIVVDRDRSRKTVDRDA